MSGELRRFARSLVTAWKFLWESMMPSSKVWGWAQPDGLPDWPMLFPANRLSCLITQSNASATRPSACPTSMEPLARESNSGLAMRAVRTASS